MEVIRDAAKILQRARQDSNLRLRRYQKFEKGRRKTLESPDFFRMSLGIATLQTLAFVTLVCGNQSTTHAVRARRRIWALPHPCRWLIISSVADVLIAATLATLGWLMMPLPLWIVSGVIVGAIAFAFFLDLVKLLVFSRLKIV
jgi:H+-transporting ATPase